MNALVFTQPYEMIFREEPDPVPGDSDSVIQVQAAGICGSDLHAFYGHDPRRIPPLILGHEVAGKVVSGEKVGNRVVINPLITCGTCKFCREGRSNLCRQREMIGMNRGGAFAELVSVPSENLLQMPVGLDWVSASITEPTATIVHAFELTKLNSRSPLAEKRCLVIGGGAIGLLSALLLKGYGCHDIVLSEINPHRRKSAEIWVGCNIHDPMTEPDLPDNTFDLVVDAVGGQLTRQLAVKCVIPGGIILHIGLKDSEGVLDIRKITLSEITIIGVYTYTPDDLKTAIDILHSDTLSNLGWIETYSLSDGSKAFEDLHKGNTAAAKVVLLP
jgi:alcohol dehydrogenase